MGEFGEWLVGLRWAVKIGGEPKREATAWAKGSTGWSRKETLSLSTAVKKSIYAQYMHNICVVDRKSVV